MLLTFGAKISKNMPDYPFIKTYISSHVIASFNFANIFALLTNTQIFFHTLVIFSKKKIGKYLLELQGRNLLLISLKIPQKLNYQLAY